MFDFPANPTLDQVYTQGGVSYKWNGYAWMMTSGGAGVADGDKGDIIVSGGGAVWTFDTTVVTPAAKTVLDDATTTAMLTTLGGITQAAADTRYVNAAGDSMSGNLSIANMFAQITSVELNKQVSSPSVGSVQLFGSTYGVKRWMLELGNADQEYYSGGPELEDPDLRASSGTVNGGSNFTINRYLDNGTLVDSPIKIDRLSGVVDFTKTPTVLGVAIGGGGSSGMLPLAGGTMTGAITLKQTSGGIAVGSGNSGLEVKSAGTAADGAYISFHRPSAYAVHFGLDTDNQLVVGGWSMGATRSVLYHTGNFNPAAYLPLNGGTCGGFQIVSNSGHGGIFIGYGGNAGVLGYNYGQSMYGALSYGGYALYTPYNMYAGQASVYGAVLTVNGILYATGSAASTTTNGTNTYINPSGNIHRSTSSKAYKTALEPLEAEYADKVLQLQTVFYRPTADTVDRTDWSRYGFVAEDAYAVDPRFSVCEKVPTGREPSIEFPDADPPMDPQLGALVLSETEIPIIHDLNAIVAALLDVVRRQEARIKVLEGVG